MSEVDGACLVSIPFLDRRNDAIEIDVEQKNRTVQLTDNGRTIGGWRASDMAFTTEKRNAHFAAVLNGCGVKCENDELCVEVSIY